GPAHLAPCGEAGIAYSLTLRRDVASAAADVDYRRRTSGVDRHSNIPGLAAHVAGGSGPLLTRHGVAGNPAGTKQRGPLAGGDAPAAQETRGATMRFWIREIAGWGLVLLGLYLFSYCLLMLVHGRVIESGPWTLVAIIVFRGGIHLLKVAVAARVCEQADA